MHCNCPACWQPPDGPEEDEVGPLTSRTVRFAEKQKGAVERPNAFASSIYSDKFWVKWLADANRQRCLDWLRSGASA